MFNSILVFEGYALSSETVHLKPIVWVKMFVFMNKSILGVFGNVQGIKSRGLWKHT